MFWMLALGAASGIKAGMENKGKQKQIKAANKAARAADDRTIANAGQEISALNVQNGMLRVQAARQLNEAGQAAYAASGSAIANAAAAQVKGASVDAVLGDIDRELGEARTATEQALETGQYNIVNRIRETVSSASNALIGQKDPFSQDQSPLMAGLMTMGSAYINNTMKFGGGNTGSWFSGGSGAKTFAAGRDTAQGLTFGN